MVSLGPTGPYRKGAEVIKDMHASEVAQQIQRIYAKRFGQMDCVSVAMNYRRYYTSPLPSERRAQKTRTEEEKYKREWSARLMYGDTCLAEVRSKESFDDATIKLAQQLDVRL